MIAIAVTEDFKALGVNTIVAAEVSDVAIRRSDAALEEITAELATELGNLDLDADPILKSYRQLVRSVGRSPRKFPPAAESLVRRAIQTGRLPHINAAVDSYNVASARSRLAFRVHDRAKLSGPIRFRLSPGDEPFTAVGGETTKRTQAGDYVYADDARALAWLYSNDSDDVKLSENTSGFVISVQGTPETSTEYRVQAVEEACAMIVHSRGASHNVAAHDCR